MKTIFSLALAASAVSGLAQTGTVSVAAFGRSIAITPATAYRISDAVSHTVYFTSYDTNASLPQIVPLTNGIGVSSEVRPRPGTATYDADYAFYLGSRLAQHGRSKFRIPTVDSDYNRVPELLDFRTNYYATVSAALTNYWPSASGWSLDARFVRSADSTTGSFTGILTGSSTMQISGGFAVLSFQGAADYVRGNPSQIQWTLTRTDQNGDPEGFTGTSTYTANSGSVSLSRFTLVSTNGTSYAVRPATLSRYGKRYVGTLTFVDGAAETPWVDFQKWIIEITDPADSNGNGIPDFSDPSLIPDTTGPVVSITSPAQGARVTSPMIKVQGTARDAHTVLGVAVRLENASGISDYQVASGTTAWTITLDTLAPGTNLLRVVAWDDSQNLSAEVMRTVTFVVLSPLTVAINGNGTVTPNLNGQGLEIGRAYRLTAAPAAGNLFSHWSGDFFSDSAALVFPMQSNMFLQANFMPNPFLLAKGTYYGLFADTSGPSASGSGMITFTLGSAGAYSGRIRIGTNAWPIAGKVGLDGLVQASVKRRNANPLSFAFRLDLTNGTDRLAGSVTDGAWTADLEGGRGVLHPGVAVALRQRFSILIPSSSPEAPAAPGCGTVSLDNLGRMRLVGSLSDGTPISQAIPLFKDGDWPVYVPLYGGTGALMGWLHFEATGVNNPSGALDWIRPPQPLARRFPAGFTNEAAIIGTLYLPMTNLVQFGWTNGLIRFAGGDLTSAFSNSISLLPNNRVRNNGANILSLKFSLATGRFSGSVRPPGSALALPFQGVLQNLYGQSAAVGYGYFLGPAVSGTVVLQPASP